MTSLTTQLETISLLSHLPEKLEFATDCSCISIHIEVGTAQAYETILYPYNGVATVNDFRSIVETSMKAHGYGIRYLYIEFGGKEDSSFTIVEDMFVIYATHKVKTTTQQFLKTKFLMSSQTLVLPRNITVPVYYYHDGSIQNQISIDIFFTSTSATDEVSKYTWEGGTTAHTYQEYHIRSMEIGASTLAGYVLQGTGLSGRILSATLHIGNRTLTLFFTEELPVACFRFINAFGCRETMPIFGKETVKTETEHSEALLGRKTMYYDETTKVTHEIETAPLTYNQALTMNQLLTSPDVNIMTYGDAEEPVLLSDLSSEISSSDKDEVKLKFTWRYTDGMEYL